MKQKAKGVPAAVSSTGNRGPKWKRFEFRRTKKGKTLKHQLNAMVQRGELSAMGFELAFQHVHHRACCSASWGEAVWNDGVQYPPQAQQTPMVQCRLCRVFHPPSYVSSRGVCYDCQLCGFRDYEIIDAPNAPEGIEIVPGPAMRLASSTSSIPIYALPRAERDAIHREVERQQRYAHWRAERRKVHSEKKAASGEGEAI